ncbi:MAG: hypothetical protein ACE5EM_01335 [Sphingomonadales bacterium]
MTGAARVKSLTEDALEVGLAHLEWAHSVGQTNSEILASLDEAAAPRPTDFHVVGRIALWYLRTFWIVQDAPRGRPTPTLDAVL